MARDSYSYLHLPMVAGIILFAVGVKKTLGDVGEPLKLIPAVALCGGVAMYLVAHVLFRLRNVRHVQPAPQHRQRAPAGAHPGGGRAAGARDAGARRGALRRPDRLRGDPLRRGPRPRSPRAPPVPHARLGRGRDPGLCCRAGYGIVRGGLRQFLRARADPLGTREGETANACYVAATETRSRRRTHGTRHSCRARCRGGRRNRRRRSARRRARLPRQERRGARRHERRRRRRRRHEPVPQLAQRRHSRQPQPARGGPGGLRRARDRQRRCRRARDLRRRQPRPARRTIRRREPSADRGGQGSRGRARPRRAGESAGDQRRRRPGTGNGRVAGRDLRARRSRCAWAGSRPRTACGRPGSSSSTTPRRSAPLERDRRRRDGPAARQGRLDVARQPRHAVDPRAFRPRVGAGPAGRERDLAEPGERRLELPGVRVPAGEPERRASQPREQPGRFGRVAVRLARHERHPRPRVPEHAGEQRARVPRPGRRRGPEWASAAARTAGPVSTSTSPPT